MYVFNLSIVKYKCTFERIIHPRIKNRIEVDAFNISRFIRLVSKSSLIFLRSNMVSGPKRK